MSEKNKKTKKPFEIKLTQKGEQKISRPLSVRTIAICNQKGGCGKTTTIINVAAGLASLGQRVLVVDLDSQCNATTGLGIQTTDEEKSIFDLLVDPKKTLLEDVVFETQYENVHIIPGAIELSEFESRMASEIGRENKLKKSLSPLSSLYDFILIDTPPSLGLLSINALSAAKEIFIALQAHPFAFDGLQLLLQTIDLIKTEINPSLQTTGLIVTMLDARTKISREIVDKVNEMDFVSKIIFKTAIRQNIKITEAAKARKSVIDYDPSCTGAEDYLNLSKEICAQNQIQTYLSIEKQNESEA